MLETILATVCVALVLFGAFHYLTHRTTKKDLGEYKALFVLSDQAFKERGLKHLQSVTEDFEFFEEFGQAEDLEEFKENLRDGSYSFSEMKQALQKFEEVGNINDYGLSFDFVEPDTFDDQPEGYHRYQMSWGGPSDEIRFYPNKVEYVFMDWFVGVGFDVTDKSWIDYLKGYLAID